MKEENQNQSSQSENQEDVSIEDKAIKEIEAVEGDNALDDELDKPIENILKNKNKWYKSKVFIVSSSLIAIVALIIIIPFTRYKVFGLFIHEKYTVTVIDKQTGLPVTGATIQLGNKKYVTGPHGKSVISANVGNQKISISKKYYSNLTKDIFVPFSQKQSENLSLVAIGRQVSITVTNSISKKAVSGALITADGTVATTDSMGKAKIVLSANYSTVRGVISGKGFNNLNAEINIGSSINNSFQILPSGSVYFLSNSSGNIDVVKTSLDGSNLTTVLAGKGTESIYNTSLTPNRSWSYIALVSNRNNTKPCLTIINTSNDSSYVVDQTNGTYNIIGWDSNDNLIYNVRNDNIPNGSAGQFQLKTYNASSNQINVIDQTNSQTSGTNMTSEVFDTINLLPNNSIIYSKSWSGDTSSFKNLQMIIEAVNSNNTGKITLQQFDQASYGSFISSHLNGPETVVLWLYPLSSNTATLFQYSNYKFSTLTNNQVINNLYSMPSTYPLASSIDKVIYSSNVNGHSAIISSSTDGSSQKQLALLGNTYSTYSWFGDDYIILNNNGNEFFIMPAIGITDPSSLIKISDHL